MELKKIALAAAIVSIAGLYGCSQEGDQATVNITVEGDSGGQGLATSNCPSWAERSLSQVEVNGSAVDVCELPSVILESRSLTSDTIWKMAGRVTVGNGNGEMSGTAGTLADNTAVVTPTLTIQAGTQVQAATGTFANLLITRGSKIDARGTAEAPIVFSSDDDDLVGSGEWGGIILQGYGEHNRCYTAIDDPASACNIDSEGESGRAGGFDNSDSSGIMQYVIVTEGGFEFSPGNEINGISFVAVGSGTTVEYIQVDNNADDGVEYYGGAVNTKYLVVTGAGDDSVDWDEGFQGNLQYVIVKQTDNSGGNTIEADTEGTTFFNSAPFIMNASFIAGGAPQLHRMKASTGGFIVNSVMDGIDASSVCVELDGNGALANLNNSTQYLNVIHDCNVFQEDKGTGVAPVVPLVETSVFGVADVALDAAYATTATEASLANAFDPAPFANTEAGGLTDDLTADTSFLDSAGFSFSGAVAPGTAAADAWWAGWTLDGTL